MANYVKTDGPSIPTQDNAFDIGSVEKRFNDIYAQTFQGTATLAGNLTISANEGDVLVYTNNSLRWAPSGAYATKAFVTQQIAAINNEAEINLDGYVTELELETSIQNALAVYQPNIDLTPYALKTQLFSGSYDDLTDVPALVVSYNDLTDKPVIPTIPTNISAFSNDVGYLTNHQDLSQYALKTELFSGSYNDLSDAPIIPSLDGYATEVYVNTQVADAISAGTVDLSDYYTKSEVDTSITNISLTPGPKGDPGEPGPQGLPGADGLNGSDGTDGAPGQDGADGVSVTGAALNTNDDLIITLSDSTIINVGNVRGPAGADGLNGLNGADGLDGADGIDGTSYTDADVDLHLNTSTANVNEVLSWDGTDYAWVAQTSGGTSFSGSYNDLTDTPTIPADISELTDTTGLLDGGEAYDQSLNTTDTVEFAGITTSQLTVTGVGDTVITAGADVRLDSPNRVGVTQSPFRLAHMTTVERDAFIPADGDMIYNTDDSNFQVYTQGQWFRLSLTPIV